MLTRLRKAQQTAEYAIVLGLVVGAVVAMQVYVKRNLQSKVKQLTDYTDPEIQDEEGFGEMNFSYQYEPYYLASNFTVERTSSGSGKINPGGAVHTFRNASDETERLEGGLQKYEYDPTNDTFILQDDVNP